MAYKRDIYVLAVLATVPLLPAVFQNQDGGNSFFRAVHYSSPDGHTHLSVSHGLVHTGFTPEPVGKRGTHISAFTLAPGRPLRAPVVFTLPPAGELGPALNGCAGQVFFFFPLPPLASERMQGPHPEASVPFLGSGLCGGSFESTCFTPGP